MNSQFFVMNENNEAIIDYLLEFVTEARLNTLRQVLQQRTRYLTVVLEDLYQPQNASAVLRSCDGFGVQDVHIVENYNDFTPTKGVTMGADQWLTLNWYNRVGEDNTRRCYRALRRDGYRVIALSPHVDDVKIGDLSLDQKTALVFGAEMKGLSSTAMEEADGYAKIPMVGFSESFNISVSAAVTLYETTRRLRRDIEPQAWRLSEGERADLLLEWLRKSIRGSEFLEKRFKREKGRPG